MKGIADLQKIHDKMETDYAAWYNAVIERKNNASKGTGSFWN